MENMGQERGKKYICEMTNAHFWVSTVDLYFKRLSLLSWIPIFDVAL